MIELTRSVKMYQPSQGHVTNEHVGADVLICPVERKLDRVFDGIESGCARPDSRGGCPHVVRGAPARAGRSRLHCPPVVAPRRQVRARQHQQAGEECPEHQAHRQRKGAINFLEIQPGQGPDVGVLQGL